MSDRKLGHFVLADQIGEGGMGRVYKALDTRLSRHVAIKVLAGERVADPVRRERFLQEARTASALNHPNIVTVHEIAEQDGQTFIVMELVQGRALSELIAPTGMRLTEALRIAAQVADALAAAHAAGIVHRDLKPANIMVDDRGRVKVLDFGLAKLLAPASSGTAAAGESTVTMRQALTEEGAIVGSVPYMSPEQAEGRAVEARSDIFSFGAVLYEMISGRRAFEGNSRISTLAAVVEKEPAPLSEIAPATPPEVERLIGRCLRKDPERRCQTMGDVRAALEELGEESASGTLAQRPRPRRRFGWKPLAAGAGVVAAALVFASLWSGRRAPEGGPELTQLSPDDGHRYEDPAISTDGRFVAYVSDRGGKNDLWLQQVGGGDPIQLTHTDQAVESPSFFPDGTRIAYVEASRAVGGSGRIKVIPALGGEPRVLAEGAAYGWVRVSPDGSRIAYLESAASGPRVKTLSSRGGQPQELGGGASLMGPGFWSADGREVWLASLTPGQPWEIYVAPAGGGAATATGAGDVLRASGIQFVMPAFEAGGRLVFGGQKQGRMNVWDIPLAAGSKRVEGTPRQVTFGTDSEYPTSVSATGRAALTITKFSSDLYLLPVGAGDGLPTGPARRLTRDGRQKFAFGIGDGDPASVYFWTMQTGSGYAVDLQSGRQTPLGVKGAGSVASGDGRQIAYPVEEGNRVSIRLAAPGAEEAASRLACKGCGRPLRFSPDGKLLAHTPEATTGQAPPPKATVRLLDLASGEDRAWLPEMDGSVAMGAFGTHGDWSVLSVSREGGALSTWLVPWRDPAPPRAEWIEVKPAVRPSYSAGSDRMYFVMGAKVLTAVFDERARRLSAPQEVKLPAGAPRGNVVGFRPAGLVFVAAESRSGVWLMKLPR